MFTLLSFIWLWYVILAFLFLFSFIFHPIRTLKKICLFLHDWNADRRPAFLIGERVNKGMTQDFFVLPFFSFN